MRKSAYDFKAGVTFALSTPSLYMGLMEEFAEWKEANEWELNYREQHTHTTAELVTKFIEHKNKKEDEV